MVYKKDELTLRYKEIIVIVSFSYSMVRYMSHS